MDSKAFWVHLVFFIATVVVVMIIGFDNGNKVDIVNTKLDSLLQEKEIIYVEDVHLAPDTIVITDINNKEYLIICK